MECYVGEIRLFAGNYAPAGWAFCDGSLLPIRGYEQLYRVIGTRYGGDGVQTFALPNFQGMAAMGMGAAPGLTPRTLGTAVGSKEVTLRGEHIPRHTHVPCASSATGGGKESPDHSVWGGKPSLPAGNRAYTAIPDKSMNAQALNPVGGNQPHNNMQPYLALHYIIAIDGMIPPNS